MFMIMYMSADTLIELTSSMPVFLLEKEYSSEACGIQPKPTNAHGASAATAKMEASADLSGAKSGIRLDHSTPPARMTAAMMHIAPQRPRATAVPNQLAASTPRILMSPTRTMARMATSSSPPYTVQPAIS